MDIYCPAIHHCIIWVEGKLSCCSIHGLYCRGIMVTDPCCITLQCTAAGSRIDLYLSRESRHPIPNPSVSPMVHSRGYMVLSQFGNLQPIDEWKFSLKHLSEFGDTDVLTKTTNLHRDALWLYQIRHSLAIHWEQTSRVNLIENIRSREKLWLVPSRLEQIV